MLEEREQQMQLQQQRLDTSKRRWDELAKILSQVRGRVEHLSDKLQNVTLVTQIIPANMLRHFFSLCFFFTFLFFSSMLLLQTEETESELTSKSEEFVLVLLSQCEQKMQSLNEELLGNDLPAILKEMEQEEVSGHTAHNSALHNIIRYHTVTHNIIRMIPPVTIPPIPEASLILRV